METASHMGMAVPQLLATNRQGFQKERSRLTVAALLEQLNGLRAEFIGALEQGAAVLVQNLAMLIELPDFWLSCSLLLWGYPLVVQKSPESPEN